MDKYVLTTNDDGDLAIRTVSAEESTSANSLGVVTATSDGKLAIRVVGGGGGSGAVSSVNGKTGVVVLTGADLTTTVEISNATLTQALASDTIYNCGEMTSIEVTMPATADVKFIAQLNFTSGTTPTSFTSPVDMKWLGDDVSTTFVPVASKRYAILFFYDGVNYRGIVQAVA